MGDEHTIISLCDSKVVGSRLNQFEAPLPYAIKFNGQNSIGVSEISFPNLMCNINNDNNILALSFYNKAKDFATNVREINGEQYNLDMHINIPIKARYYPDIKAFVNSCVFYVNNYYNQAEHINEIIQLAKEANDKANSFDLLSIALSKIHPDDVNIKQSWLQKELGIMQQIAESAISDNIASKSSKWKLQDLWENIMNHISDPSGWKEWNKHSYLQSEECYRFWDMSAEMESTKFTTEMENAKFIYRFTNLNSGDSPDAMRESHIHKMYAKIRDIFNTLKTDTEIYDIRRHLMLSVQFWLCGVFFIDEGGVTNKQLPPISDELHIKLADFYTKTVDLSDIVARYDAHFKARFFGNNDTMSYSEAFSYQTIPYLDEILSIMGELTCTRVDMSAMAPDLLSKHLIKGVLHRIDLFFKDIKKLLKNAEIFREKRISEKKSAHTNTVDYIESQKGDYVYYDPDYAANLTRHGANIYEAVHNEIINALSRMKYNGHRFVIEPSRQTNSSDYVRFTFHGDEIPSLLGHNDDHIMVEKKREFIAHVAPNINLKNTHLMLYCSEIRPQAVNDSRARVLAVVPIDANASWGAPMHVTFRPPHFLQIASTYLDTLHFELRTVYGDLVKFEDSSQTVIIVSVVRPTRRHQQSI